MDDINKLNETGGAGDWGTDKARAKLQKDTPGQEITKGKKMKTFKDVLTGIDEAYRKPTAAEIKKDKERERKASGKSRSSMSHKSAKGNMYGKMMGGLKDDVQEAMSPAEKKKRLLLIKQAVEKLNRANAEKVKKDALAHMKASGMFDEDLDESTIDEALGNKNPSHREKLKLDKDGTIHNIPGKKMGSAYSIKPRIDGGVLKFGTVDEFGNINTMTLADLAKVIK